MRQKIPGRIHNVNPSFRIGYSDMNMQAKDQKRTGDALQFLDQQLVPFIIENLLVLPARNRMGRTGDNHQAAFRCQSGDDAAQPGNVRAGLLDVFADTRADLNHRLNHLRLNLLAQQHFAFFEEFGNVRTKFTCLRIDDLKLFFDTQSELIEHNQRPR
jgi:hypothetical protein